MAAVTSGKPHTSTKNIRELRASTACMRAREQLPTTSFRLLSPLSFFLFMVNQSYLFPFCYFLLLPPLPSTTTTLLPPYRWRLTGERSAIRPCDCLLLRRWMEAPSASPTQPQLHQPP
ncbi:Hypothetical predicted protein [Xyrichtys novacula]|uniref:Uncharacterized protein n=1 Tax=Xyrichtys novacula TaxID=13765 RepID=A0AAV1FY81_XYRNO|nr:Hypothetical predicted protein [Xyrichtys novacula]